MLDAHLGDLCLKLYRSVTNCCECRKLAAAFAGERPQGRDLAWDFFVRCASPVLCHLTALTSFTVNHSAPHAGQWVLLLGMSKGPG